MVDEVDDVFFLTTEEALAADDLICHGVSHRSLVAGRKADLDRCRRLNPPPALGTDYGPPPDDIIGRFLTKFFGAPRPRPMFQASSEDTRDRRAAYADAPA